MMALSRHSGKEKRGLQIGQIQSFDKIRKFPSMFWWFSYIHIMRKKNSCTTTNSKIVHVPKYSASNTASSAHFWQSVQTAGMQWSLPGTGSHFQWLATARLPGSPACLFNSCKHLSSCVLTLYIPQSPVAGGFTVSQLAVEKKPSTCLCLFWMYDLL